MRSSHFQNPSTVGFSFFYPQIKVTVLDKSPEWAAKQATDAEKKRRWQEDEAKVLFR